MKKKILVVGIAIVLAGILLFLTGCGEEKQEQENSNNNDTIVGTWKGTTTINSDAGAKAYDEEYIFYEDGTYKYITTTYPQERTSKYKLEGDQLTMWQFGNAKDMPTTWTVKYNEEGYDIVLTSNDDIQTIFKGNKE